MTRINTEIKIWIKTPTYFNQSLFVFHFKHNGMFMYTPILIWGSPNILPAVLLSSLNQSLTWPWHWEAKSSAAVLVICSPSEFLKDKNKTAQPLNKIEWKQELSHTSESEIFLCNQIKASFVSPYVSFPSIFSHVVHGSTFIFFLFVVCSEFMDLLLFSKGKVAVLGPRKRWV